VKLLQSHSSTEKLRLQLREYNSWTVRPVTHVPFIPHRFIYCVSNLLFSGILYDFLRDHSMRIMLILFQLIKVDLFVHGNKLYNSQFMLLNAD